MEAREGEALCRRSETRRMSTKPHYEHIEELLCRETVCSERSLCAVALDSEAKGGYF